jgi:hypothetical protein
LNPEAGYAYQWKTNEDGAFTYGYGEQAIYILPAKNLILVTTGGSPVILTWALT